MNRQVDCRVPGLARLADAPVTGLSTPLASGLNPEPSILNTAFRAVVLGRLKDDRCAPRGMFVCALGKRTVRLFVQNPGILTLSFEPSG